ncbi:MAG TPA: site-2 protease family protein [Firmicutes bacterium]|nr:site-2 protease family protein [Bacillota bacterium]
MGNLSLDNLPYILLTVLPIGLMAVTLHEVSHGWVAKRFGDPTADMEGRLSLNPIKHIDPIGALMIVIIGFGWAKPVPVNPAYFKRPGRDMMWVGLAGPISNILFAIVFAILLRITVYVYYSTEILPLEATMAVIRFFQFGIMINVILAAFNMIPIPPLDGSRVLAYFLPRDLEMRYRDLERYGMFILIGVIFVLPWVTNGRIDVIRIVAGGALRVFQTIFL